MPHIIIEYTTDSIEDAVLERLLDEVYAAVVASQLFDENNIKVRAIPIEHYRLAAAKRGFIHVQCRIHQGRNDQQKQQLSQLIVKRISDMQLMLSVTTCEVVEMYRPGYAKC